jgi:hypothetical protein
MKTRVLILFGLLLALFSHAADQRVTMRVAVTNLPVTGNNLSFSAPASKVITWTNTTASTWVETNTTVNGCASNLFFQLAAHAPWTPRPALIWANTNAFDIIGEVNQSILATNSGTWATLTLSTQTVTRLTTVRMPLSSETGDTNRTNMASMIIKGLSDYSTNKFATNATALENHLSLGPHPQTVTGLKTFNQFGGTNKTTIWGGTNDGTRIQNASYLNGTSGSYTNLYTTNQIADSPKTTNLVNYGNAISSPGPSYATSSEQFGTGASATNTSALAVGNQALAGGNGSTAIGQGSVATNEQANAWGAGAIAGGRYSIAAGVEATATGTNSIAFNGASIHDYSIVFSGTSTTNYQFFIGGDIRLFQTTARGQFESLTNNTFTGTNVNKGAWSDTPVTITSLANGNNVLNPANAKVIRLAAGPTAAFGINSIQGGWDGRDIEVWNDTGQALTVYHESGFDATNVNRVITTGADVVFGTNVYLNFRYFDARSRWKLSGSRE